MSRVNNHINLDAKGREEGGTYLIGGKKDVRALQQTRAQHVSESVILFVEGEDGRGGNTCGHE